MYTLSDYAATPPTAAATSSRYRAIRRRAAKHHVGCHLIRDGDAAMIINIVSFISELSFFPPAFAITVEATITVHLCTNQNGSERVNLLLAHSALDCCTPPGMRRFE